jgi:hypothetical protein
MPTPLFARDQRRHPRALVARPIQLEHEGLALSGLLWELGEGGARLQSGMPLPVGGRVRLRLPLGEWRGAGSRLPQACDLDGEVVRSSGGQAAVAFAARLLPRHMLEIRDLVWRGGTGC